MKSVLVFHQGEGGKLLRGGGGAGEVEGGIDDIPADGVRSDVFSAASSGGKARRLDFTLSIERESVFTVL